MFHADYSSFCSSFKVVRMGAFYGSACGVALHITSGKRQGQAIGAPAHPFVGQTQPGPDVAAFLPQNTSPSPEFVDLVCAHRPVILKIA
jgi:hypothetical protein